MKICFFSSKTSCQKLPSLASARDKWSLHDSAPHSPMLDPPAWHHGAGYPRPSGQTPAWLPAAWLHRSWAWSFQYPPLYENLWGFSAAYKACLISGIQALLQDPTYHASPLEQVGTHLGLFRALVLTLPSLMVIPDIGPQTKANPL